MFLAMSFLLSFLEQTAEMKEFYELADAQRQGSSGGCDSGDHDYCALMHAGHIVALLS